MWLMVVLTLPAAHPSGAADAADAVADAERAVASARKQDALWTSAEEAVRQARRALAGGDAAAAIKHAVFASEQARLGIGQKQYPPTPQAESHARRN
jgi:hypothetical protein